MTKKSTRQLNRLTVEKTNEILKEVVENTRRYCGAILDANLLDLNRMEASDPKYDRLKLTEARLEAIERDLYAVSGLESPLGLVIEARTLPSGLQLQKISVPLGVVGIIYESRPNVTFDVFSLCFKSGNATVLKGSRDAHYSNEIIVRVIKEVLESYDLAHSLLLTPSDREALSYILQASHYIDVLIPRGSAQLIEYVRQHSGIPVIETGAGIVHTYFDESADLEKGKNVILNAKTRRVSVCNALDTLLIHQSRVHDLKNIFEGCDRKFGLTIFADAPSYEILREIYDSEHLMPATEKHFGTEFLSMKMSIRTVQNLDEALEHINQYGSRHSEAIIAEDQSMINQFFREVDAAIVYCNASTAFTDGSEFGLGAEIGISTQKLHARGPMGLRELTSYKWVVRGDGQIRI